jgi:hypothetical protein
MTVIAPERSLTQRLDALGRANEVRVYRAQLKRDMKAGLTRFPDVLDSTDPLLATMRVFDLLVSIPKVRRVKAQAVLAKARVSPSKTLGGLTARQRRDLLLRLAEWPSVARALQETASVRPAGTIQS